MFKSKLFQRVFFISTLLIVVSIVSVLSLYYYAFEKRFVQEVDTLLKNEVFSIELYFQDKDFSQSAHYPYFQKLYEKTNNRISIIDSKGIVLFDSGKEAHLLDNHLMRPEVVDAKIKEWGRSQSFSDTLGTNFYYITKMVDVQGKPYFVRLARSIEVMNQDLNRILWQLIVVGLLIIAFSSFLLYFSLQYPLKQIGDIIQAAKKIIQGNYDVRVPVGEEINEIALMGQTMNHLASNLQNQMRSLKDSRKMLMQILTHLEDGLVAIDDQDQIDFFNQAWLTIVENENVQLRDILHQYMRHKTIREMIEESRESNTHLQKIVEIEKKQGIATYLTQVFVIDLEDRKLTILSMSDVTQVRKAEELKREFIANASHQLKTPMAAIQGYAETLLDYKDLEAPKKDEILEKILDRSKVATDMVVKLLTLTKIHDLFEKNKMKNIDLAVMLEQIKEKHEMDLAKKNISLEIKCGEIKVFTNKKLLEIVLSSLLENAIQYTNPDTKIFVICDQSEFRTLIQIKDQGIGIDPSEMDQIFERFYRSPKAQEFYAQGTGIGLALVRMCTELLGANISVESQVGQGSTFVLEIPAKKGFTDPSSKGSKGHQV